MALPQVRVTLFPGGHGEVWLDDERLPGVTAVNVSGAIREDPQVTVTLTPDRVVAHLPETAVTVLRPGGAADFADAVNAARLEELALDHLELHPDDTQGEAFTAALGVLAAEFERTRD